MVTPEELTYDAQEVIAKLSAKLAEKTVEVAKAESALAGLAARLTQAHEELGRYREQAGESAAE